ncbi:MAG TPA: alpha-E domain-containing protein [Verrucomicrobiae bacterium]|nr:alpha-E domain-containing protein [Verrucomicrobiae bacterium]
MLSRVADSIYWMSRYIERAENVARFIDVNLHLMLDLPTGSDQQWRPLVDTTGDHEEFARRFGEATQANVIQFLTLDPDNPNSILSCLRAARENARSVREVISSEMWEQLNKFYLMVNSAGTDPDVLADPHEFFSNVRMSSHLFVGVTEATMTHGEGWHFGRLGRMLERADKTSRILDVKYYILLPTVAHVGTTFDDLQWAAVLRSTSAFEMYRKTHGRIDPRRIVEFLLLDTEFPRAIHHCLIASRESIHAITGTPTGLFRNPAEQLLAQLCADLAYGQVDDIVNAGLHEYLDGLQTNMNQVGTSVAETFFAAKMAPPSTRKRTAIRA